METTVVSVVTDVISAADHGQVTALVLLDLNSAYDFETAGKSWDPIGLTMAYFWFVADMIL